MCANAFESCEWRLFGNEFGNENTSDQTKFSQDSTKSNKSASLNKLLREIELEKRQAEIDAEYELARARVKKECEEAKIKAEQKLLNRSERCLSASSRGESVSVQSRRRSDRGAQASKAKLDMDQSLDFNAYEVRANSTMRSEIETLPKTVLIPKQRSKPLSPVKNNLSAVHEYLVRQGRNEYINLASQIAYNRNNIAFVFYENQIRRLMEESPLQDRRLEVLRASCVGQPREIINLFFAPFKSMTTEQRIDRALDRLRQRYGVSGGFLSEPMVLEIRKGSKVTHIITLLKSFNEDLKYARGICVCA